MKKFYLLLILVFASMIFQASASENSWINYNQKYYKIRVWQEGVYRISANSLLLAGIPATADDHRTYQLFRNGQEQYIFIYDENGNNHIDPPNDYIEFYGQKNDGSLDSNLYKDRSWQPNTNFSLFTDTAVYFLTANTSLVNRRMIPDADTTYSSYNPSPYFIRESYREETVNYNAGTTISGSTEIEYTEAEGWMD